MYGLNCLLKCVHAFYEVNELNHIDSYYIGVMIRELVLIDNNNAHVLDRHERKLLIDLLCTM